MNPKVRKILFGVVVLVLAISCRKQETLIDNTAPYYGTIATVLIENYINRSFIDLIGREPFDEEMEHYLEHLRSNDLSMDSGRYNDC